MTHLEQELYTLKLDTSAMMTMVLTQVEKTEKVLKNFDKEIIRDIKHLEKKIDAYELKISMDCENTLALFSPVAIDLRFVLAVLKMVTSIERLGDYVRSVSGILDKLPKPIDKELLELCKVVRMFEIAKSMLTHVQEAFDNVNSIEARIPLKLDDELDELAEISEKHIIQWIAGHPDDIECALKLMLIIKRVERFGNQIKNISHEIIFHQEAKVFKHHKKKIQKAKDSVNFESEE